MLKPFNLSETKYLLKLTAIGWFIYKLSTIKLWFIYERSFPIISISNDFEITNLIFHNAIGLLSFTMLLWVVYKTRKTGLWLVLFFESLLMLTDVMRWQPPVFQFYITFLIYLIHPKQFKTYFILLLSATYFFSGLQKFNLRFINFFWSFNILNDFIGIPFEFAFSKPLKAIGFIIPLIEMLSGLFILTKWKKYAFITIIITHIFILTYIGPFNINYNSAVWGWNIIMIGYALFFIRKPMSIKLNFNLRLTAWLTLIYLLPFLNLFEKYYPYFSFDLYTGTKHYFYIFEEVEKDSPLVDYAYTSKDKKLYFDKSVIHWAFDDLNAPFTHDKWLYKRLIHSYNRKYPTSSPCFEISYYPFKTKEAFLE